MSSATLAGLGAACLDPAIDGAPVGRAEQALAGGTTTATPIGLALEVENGVGTALSVRRGQTFYVNQIDLRAFQTATVDEGVQALATSGDFRTLGWGGIDLVDEEPVLLGNADGTFVRRRFYRNAEWMDVRSTFTVEQIDAQGAPTAPPVVVNAGRDRHMDERDDFWDRRFRAIQWTYDCRALHDCTGAKTFQEEALVELRYALHPEQTFTMQGATTALRVTWSLKSSAPYTVPVTQVDAMPFDYGFTIDADPITPPRADGTYAPGSDISFRVTLRDGAGNRLHGAGGLPTYNEVVFGSNPAGIQYYRAFFDPTTTYYRRKHRERMMMADFVGPAQNAQPIRAIADMSKFLAPDDVQTVGTLEADGFYAQFRTFPTAHDLFGGAFDPNHAGWANPVPDTWTHHVPDNAPDGTYYVNIKGRRVYMGQDIPYSRTVEIQVGSPARTTPRLGTGPCTSCHSGPATLGRILHANDNRGTCAGCHVPLGFELEGPIYVRTHFIHSRSRRFDAPLSRCSECHLTSESIQRTSKSACLSCHKSYPESHVKAYGPIESMYVGGGRESFAQCTSTCHVEHPESGL